MQIDSKNLLNKWEVNKTATINIYILTIDEITLKSAWDVSAHVWVCSSQLFSAGSPAH